MIYHEKYKHIKLATIKEIRATIKTGFFKMDYFSRYTQLWFLLNELCKIYNIKEEKKPYIAVDNSTNGYFNPSLNVIALNNKLSLITFLHEFKHFLQHYNNKRNSEDIARAWSLSVYYQATPRLYLNALQKGLIIHEKINTKHAS